MGNFSIWRGDGIAHIAVLEGRVPAWAGVWFSVFPTAETLLAQAVAALLVIGSFFGARRLQAA